MGKGTPHGKGRGSDRLATKRWMQDGSVRSCRLPDGTYRDLTFEEYRRLMAAHHSGRD